MSESHLTAEVRRYWEREACGTGSEITGALEPLSRQWFSCVEAHRYRIEPFIHSIAQFSRHGGKRLLEVGVGAGTDHLQWARSGAECHGVDLTQAAIDTTRAHLASYGLESDLQRINAEQLPFPDRHFDLVWSWGVIHHSERPQRIIEEMWRVLKPGGQFLGMIYHRHSLAGMRRWIKHGLLRGRPWRSLSDVIWYHNESVGTKAYTRHEADRLLTRFSSRRYSYFLTVSDVSRLPRFVSPLVPARFGWYLAIEATR